MSFILAKKDLTPLRLRELLEYDQLTGVFTRRVRASNAKAGAVAGCKDGYGYIVIRVLGCTYKAHRLAWLYVNGALPEGQIDHIDGNRSNNAFSNLRDVTNRVNLQNQRSATSQSSHGFLGVTRNGKGWQAKIRAGGKQISLGTFNTPELAHTAYIKAKRRLHDGCTI